VLYPKDFWETEKHDLQLEIVPERGISFEYLNEAINATLRTGFTVMFCRLCPEWVRLFRDRSRKPAVQ
jgi:hypothetical protein